MLLTSTTKKYNSNSVKLDEATYFHTPDGLWGDAIYSYNAHGGGTAGQEALTPQKIREKLYQTWNLTTKK